MEYTKKRSIQDVFDEMRITEQKLEDENDELECLKESVKENKSKIKLLKKDIKKLSIDLIKDKKIEWVESDMNGWRKHVSKPDNEHIKYYIYYYDGSIDREGYFKEIEELTNEDDRHFNKYLNDYFYYGYPNYLDRNHHLSESSECELAFGSGAAYYKSFEFN